MAVFTPIPFPSFPGNPVGYRLRQSLNNVSEIWDAATLDVARNDLITVNVDSHIEAIGIGELVEIRPNKTIKEVPSSAVTMFIKSDNVGDLHPVLITYLDDQFLYQQGLVVLDGTTPIELPPMTSIYTIENFSGDMSAALLGAAGVPFTNGPALGRVTIYVTGGTGDYLDAKTQAYYNGALSVDAGICMEKSLESARKIPAGFRAFAFNFNTLVGKNDEIFLSIQTRQPGGNWVTRIPFQMYQMEHSRLMEVRFIPEMWDIRVLAKETGGTAGIPVSFGYQILCVKVAT